MQNVKAEKAEVELAGDLDVKKVHARELTPLCSCMFLIFCAGGSDDGSDDTPQKKKDMLVACSASSTYCYCTIDTRYMYSTTNDHKFLSVWRFQYLPVKIVHP